MNKHDITERAIPKLGGSQDRVVKWCIDNFMNIPDRGNIGKEHMKTKAIKVTNTKSLMMLDSFLIPPCPFLGAICGYYPDCIVSKYQNNWVLLL